MIDSLINTLLVIAGLYVYLSLFRQVTVRQNGAAVLGDREFGVPEAAAAILLIGWFALNVLAASKVEHATFQTRDLLITGAFSLAVISILTALLQSVEGQEVQGEGTAFVQNCRVHEGAAGGDVVGAGGRALVTQSDLSASRRSSSCAVSVSFP